VHWKNLKRGSTLRYRENDFPCLTRLWDLNQWISKKFFERKSKKTHKKLIRVPPPEE